MTHHSGAEMNHESFESLQREMGSSHNTISDMSGYLRSNSIEGIISVIKNHLLCCVDWNMQYFVCVIIHITLIISKKFYF